MTGAVPSKSVWRENVEKVARDRRAVVSLTVILIICFGAIFAPLLSPYPPDFQNASALTLTPTWHHPFGTDSLGRDLFSRVLQGSQVSMAVAFITAFSGLFLGCLYGATAGFCGGAIDLVLMATLDLFYTLPTILVLILINVLCGGGMAGILFALSLEGMMTVARLVRGQVLTAKEADYVQAARALGVSNPKILFKHLFPNLLGPIIVTLTFLIPSNVMYEAFLSFIGLGVQPPYSSWGTLANEGWRGLLSYPHLILFPGLAIFITMLAFNFFGDGLRDAFDPKGEYA